MVHCKLFVSLLSYRRLCQALKAACAWYERYMETAGSSQNKGGILILCMAMGRLCSRGEGIVQVR